MLDPVLIKFKPHLRDDGNKAHASRGVLYGTKSLTSNRGLPHCDYEGPKDCRHWA